MKFDTQKRRRVMERSMALGHCICDPRRPCPCDVFRDQGVCPCAGEKPEPMDLSQLKLTSLVRNPGCASKISASDLDSVLQRLPAVTDPAVLSGLSAADDAAIYRLSKETCIVQTVDVFTPCVDDPHLFGRICAANCLSDIYAMGGEPRTALSILGFPSETLDGEVMYRMLAGAMETMATAGVALVGGHSIKDEEIKLGFAVTGLIDPAVALALEKPHPGDQLFLTKPLGTGVLSFARQIGRLCASGLRQAEVSMAELNLEASRAMREAGASACTDVTGFGLFGHLYRLARQGGVSARIYAEALPAFDDVLVALRENVISGGIERNREYVGDVLRILPGVEEARVHLGFDPQTSGGLLIATSQEAAPQLRRALASRQVSFFEIGTFFASGAATCLELVAGAPVSAAISIASNPDPMTVPNSRTQPETPCCAGASVVAQDCSSTASAFGQFIEAVQAPGALDAKTKELMLLTLVIYSRCAPCFAAHLEKARTLGITDEEIEEAAWCAISMGGAPVRMFYREAVRNRS